MNPTQPPAQTLQLKDIHLPDLPGFWPPAPGWWLVALLALALLIWAGVALRHYLLLRRQRKQVLGLLTQLEQQFDPKQATHHLAQLSILLRRVAVTRYSRHRVAALTGTDWLQFLDETGGNGQFCNGPGAVLATGPYQPHIEVEIDQLLPLVRDWIRRNCGVRS